jgi:hypothetical protein
MKQQQRVCAAPRCDDATAGRALSDRILITGGPDASVRTSPTSATRPWPEPVRAAVVALREEVVRGTIGPVHAIELVFHNAYGPDKPWFQDPALSGSGCVTDLARLACSWFSHEGRDAVIETTFRRRDGAAGR